MSQQPALLYFARSTPSSAKPREALPGLGLRVGVADGPPETAGLTRDDPATADDFRKARDRLTVGA